MNAINPLLWVCSIVVVLVADVYANRPHQIPAPAVADSLAGVVARVVGGDSASVGRIKWYVAPDRMLRWSPSDEYAYRGIRKGQMVPIVAEADIRRYRITFAEGNERDVEITKHEIAHILLRTPTHPAEPFKRLEAYRGR